MIRVRLVEGHVWLRLTQRHDGDPFDASFARDHGGRWNPPGSWRTLYLNEEMATVHAQVRRLFAGRGIEPDDLDDRAPIELAAATLPHRQTVAEVITDEGVLAAGLSTTYPLDATGRVVDHASTQTVGERAHGAGLRGVWCRSATLVGNELAWFPANGAWPRPSWSAPRPYAAWRHAITLADVVVS